MLISLIAALSDNAVIGNDNKLPWHFPEDLKYFKEMTVGKPIIMGRKTFASMNHRALPDRHNIILTRDQDFNATNCTVVHSIAQALEAAGDGQEIMIIGGAEIYQLFLPYASRLYLTFVHQTISGDTFFPALNWQEWQKVSEENLPHLSWTIWDKKSFVQSPWGLTK